MAEPIQPGRVDHLAKGIFDRLLKRYANPELRFTCKMLEDEITDCFTENLGPGTTAHKVGTRIMKALGEGQ